MSSIEASCGHSISASGISPPSPTELPLGVDHLATATNSSPPFRNEKGICMASLPNVLIPPQRHRDDPEAHRRGFRPPMLFLH